MSGDLPASLLRQFAAVAGPAHVLTGDAAAGYAVDWTGGFHGHAPAVLRPRDTREVAALLALCSGAGVAVVPQGGNTGLVGGGVPLHGEVVLSLSRLDRLGPVDLDAGQVSAGAGVSLQQVADAHPGLDLGVLIASRHSATVGGAVATNAGGLRVLRHGPMRAQLRGIEAVLSDGTVLSHMAGLVKDNTGYDYPSLLAGSEGTLAVITAARLQLVPRKADPVTVIVGADGPGEVHALARRAVRKVGGLLSAEYFTQAGLDLLAEHAGLALPLRPPTPAYLLLEAAGPGAAEELAELAGDRPAAVGTGAAERARLWACRERHPDYCRFVTGHHMLEDEAVFPHLRAREAGLEPVIDRLADEHKIIHQVLNDVDQALVDHLRNPADFTGLQQAVDVLTDALLSHLAYEEAQLVDPLARHGFYSGQV
jgi:FAD/FMN-containing dehydrogenase